MLYHLFTYLQEQFNTAGAGLFDFISFRAGAAIILSLIISMTLGKHIIKYLHRKQYLERERDLGLPGEALKQKTPSMGGLMIIGAIVIPCLLFADLSNVYIQLLLFSTLWMGAIGFLDDYLKLTRSKEGLKGKYKVLGQVGLGLLVGVVMMLHNDVLVRVGLNEAQIKGLDIVKTATVHNENGESLEVAYVKTTMTTVPFMKDNELDYKSFLSFLGEDATKYVGFLFIPLVIFIITAVSNAANLTDGVDGLATGVSAIIGATLGILTYLSSNAIFSDYLNIMFIPGAEELVIYIACLLGGCVGFLWYNAYPAKIFMGDTGSLMLGGVIATIAVIIRKELLIPVLCGIFLAENLSVVLQVSYFKYTKNKYGEGRRIFKMSPLHHHYQKLGMHESKIVTRFWIVGVLLAIITLITLKVR